MTWARRPDWIDCDEWRAVEETDLEPHVYTVKGHGWRLYKPPRELRKEREER